MEDGGFLENARAWCVGRHRPLRALLLALLAWIGVKLFRDPRAPTLFSGIDLGIHEAGHLVFSGAGRTLMFAGGTILQLVAPIAAAGVLARQGDRFGVCVAAAWLGVNFVEVGVYVADARAQALPLVTVGNGEAQHDWAYLLGTFDLLHRDLQIGGASRGLGYALIAAGVTCGGVLVAWMGPARGRATFLDEPFVAAPHAERSDADRRPAASAGFVSTTSARRSIPAPPRAERAPVGNGAATDSDRAPD